jgi:hypothetical protein
MTTIAERVASPTEAQTQAIIQAIDTIKTAATEGGCQFWACPGPAVEPVEMATCYICWAAWDLLQAGILAAEDVAP